MTYVPQTLGQSVDLNNTTIYTNLATQFVGAWTQTRSMGFVRQLVVLASNAVVPLGGIFIFEYSEDGINTTISESRVIADFSTVRNFDLLNAGEFFRIKFTPSRPVLITEKVFINTTQRKQNDGAFVRLAGQSIEEANAALPQTFVYVQAFNDQTGKSENIRVENGGLRISTAKVNTYRSVFRTVVNPNTLSISLTAAISIHAATIHHTAVATKKLKLRSVAVFIASVSAAANICVDLVRLTTAPSGGTVIVPSPGDSSNPAAQAICIDRPSAPGTVGTFLATRPFKAIAGEKNIQINLLEADDLTILQTPSVLPLTLGGYAVVFRADATTVLQAIVNVTFTEE